MPPCLHIPVQCLSRYDLLTTFCAEVADEARALGMEINPPTGTPQAAGPHVFIIFNSVRSTDQITSWTKGYTDTPTILNWLVDHPLMLTTQVVDTLATAHRGYRLITVCPDDTHWLQFRWPGLAHLTIPHGVTPQALADPESLESSHASSDPANGGRDLGILLSGWIHSGRDLDELREQVPEGLRAPCDRLVELRLRHPELTFGQAFELSMPASVRSSNHWLWMSGVMRYTVAVVNRERRLKLVAALRGLPVTLLGGEAWREAESATTRYAGQCEYGNLSAWFKRARVVLALNPTQFVSGWSERLLLSLAGGAATLTDRRVLVERDFGRPASGAMLQMFDIANPEGLREHAQRLLNDPETRTSLAHNGVGEVSQRHLWRHRLRDLLTHCRIDLAQPAMA
jgi:hypothetical protein